MKRLLFLLTILSLTLSAQVMLPSYHGVQAHYATSGSSPILDWKFGGNDGSGASATATTPSLNCSGASKLFAVVSNITTTSGVVVTDSTGLNTGANAWTQEVTGLDGSGTAALAVWMATPAAGGAVNGMTITVNGNYPAVIGGCITGYATVDRYLNAVSGNPASPGSVTPTQDGDLILVPWVTNQVGGTADISSPASTFTLVTWHSTEWDGSGKFAGPGLAYYVQPTAAAIAPSVTSTPGTTVQVASFVALKHT